MTLRNFLLAWHIATRQNPRMAVALEQAIRGKDVSRTVSGRAQETFD